MSQKILNFGREGTRTIVFTQSFLPPQDAAGRAVRRVRDASGTAFSVSGLFEGQNIEVLNRDVQTGFVASRSGVFKTSQGCFENPGDQTPIPDEFVRGEYVTVVRVFQPDSTTQFFELESDVTFVIVTGAVSLAPGPTMPVDGGAGFREGDRFAFAFVFPVFPVFPGEPAVTPAETKEPVLRAGVLPTISPQLIVAVLLALAFIALASRRREGS